MPWKETDSMREKCRFVIKALEPGANKAELCRELKARKVMQQRRHEKRTNEIVTHPFHTPSKPRSEAY